MSWLASLAPIVMAAGTGIASAIGNHIGNKAMQNTSNVAVQSVDTSTNAPALLENVAAVPDSYANQAMPPVNGVGSTIKEQFTNTAQNLAAEAGKKVINIGADLINNAIKKLSFKEIKRKGRDLYSLGKEAYHNFMGNKEGADEEQKIRFFNYIGDNFEDNLESLLGVSQGSEALKLTTKKNVMDYIKNLHPQAFEVCFQKKDAQVEKVLNLIQTSGAKVWINTLWPSLCGGLNDDRAVENNEKDQTWGEVLKMGASFIQTDRPKELIEYLRLNNKFINNSGYVRKNLLDRNQSYVHVVAHRGDWKHFPENSLDAINSIIEMGGDVVEIDVQRTKDGVLILMHDETLDRTTNGHGIIAETMFSDIQKLNLKDYEGKLTNYKVPTLKEALLLAQGRIMLNLDKSDRFFNQVIDLLKETGTLDIAIMKGLHPLADVQTKFGKYLDDVIYMPMIRLDNKGAEDAMVEFVDGMSPVAFELGFNEVTNPLPKKAVRLINYQSLIWYNSLKGRNGGHDDVISLENPDAGFGYLIDELGARMIQTDEPQKLIEYLKRRGLH